MCTPEIEAGLRNDGSYPSGHTSVGWAWALILSEIAPERQNQILSRGLAYGQSRSVCNVHWNSDVQAGFVIGFATIARFHSNPVLGLIFGLQQEKWREYEKITLKAIQIAAWS